MNSAAYIIKLREQVARLEVQLERTTIKSGNRRTALKQMNKSLALTQMALNEQAAVNRALRSENSRLRSEAHGEVPSARDHIEAHRREGQKAVMTPLITR